MLLILVSLWLTVPVVVLVSGIVGIAKTDSFLSLTGSFVLGSIFSIVLSSIANMLLTTLPPLDGGYLDTFLVFIKTILGAFAQPTVTGVVLLSILCFLSMAVAKLVAVAEDISVLVATHTEVLSRQDK